MKEDSEMTDISGKVLFNLMETVAKTASSKYGPEFEDSFVRGYMESAFVAVLDSLSPPARADILADFSNRLMKANKERRGVPIG